jgi:hypothetical protein
MRDRRLAGASEAAQPENAGRVFAIRPVVYLAEEVDAGVGQAGRVVLSLVCVEGRVRGGGEGIRCIVQV